MIENQNMVRYKQFFFFAFFLLYSGTSFARPWLKIQHILTDDFPQVNLDVSVANGEQTYMPFVGLTSSNFVLEENGTKIENFTLTPVDPKKENELIIVLVDASLSLSKKDFQHQVQSILGFVDAVTDGDKLGVIGFHDRATLHCGFTSSRLQIRECVQKIKQGGKNTVLYDALGEGMRLLAKANNSRSALVLFTDGKDEHSKSSYRDVLRQAQNYKIPVFTIATGEQKNLTQVADISRQSGGEIFHATNREDMADIYAALPQMMDSLYRIVYSSKQTSSFSKKEITVRLKLVNTQVQDQDSLAFTLPTFAKISPWKKRLTSLMSMGDNFLLYILLFLLLLIILLLFILLFRKRGQIRLEVPPQYIHNASRETIVDSTEKVLQENSALDNEFDEYFSQGNSVASNSDVLTRYSRDEERKLEEARTPVSVQTQVYLVEKQGPQTGKKYPIQWQNITIGQGLENSIVIADVAVSLRHAQIRQKEHYFVLYDLISDQGTFLNGRKLLRPKVLKDFDEIQIGRTFLIFRQK